MSKTRTTTRGPNWQPATSQRRVAGKTRRRLPRLRQPRFGAAWGRGALVVLVIGLASTGGWWTYNSPLLSVRDVTVEGNSVVSTGLTRSIANLEDKNIFRVDLAGAKERLEALALVKDADVSRTWPNGVKIAIVERTAWGLWQVGTSRYVIDDEGVVLDLPAPLSGPVVIQMDADAAPTAAGDRVDAGAVAVAKQLVATAEQTLGRSVAALQFSNADGLTATFADSAGRPTLRVVFGDAQGYEFKVAALFAVLEQAREEGRTLSRVDLRFGDRVAVQ